MAESSVKETHIYKLFGFEVARCVIIEQRENRSTVFDKAVQYNDDKYSRIPYPDVDTVVVEENFDNMLATKWRLLQLVGVFLVAVMCLYLVYNPPLVVYSILNTAMRSCPERLQLHEQQAKTDRCEATRQSTSVALDKCTIDKGQVDSDLQSCHHEKQQEEERNEKTKSDLAGSQEELHVANTRISELKDNVREHAEKIEKITADKEHVEKILKDVQLSFGSCKKENMELEVENSKLNSKIELLKKRLEKC